MPTPPLVLKNSAFARKLPLVMLIPLVLTLVVCAGLYLTGTPLSELLVPLGGMTLLSVLLGVILLVFGLLQTAGERRAIRRLYDEHWAAWAQYDSAESWRAFAEREFARERVQTPLPWASLIVLIVVFGFVTGFSIFYLKAPTVLFFGISAMFAVVLLIVFGGTIGSRRASRATYERRLRQPQPAAYVGKWGIYDEDEGLFSLRGLRSVSYSPPGGMPNMIQAYAGYGAADLLPTPTPSDDWAHIHFSTRHQVINVDRPDRTYRGFTSVAVPPGCESEAQALVIRFQQERF